MITDVTNELLDELQAITDKATQDEWQLGHTGTETHEAAVAWMSETISKRDSPDLWMVFVGDPDKAPLQPAFTGNGPTSEANAIYLCAVQPAHISRLITEIRRQRREIERLTRRLEKTA